MAATMEMMKVVWMVVSKGTKRVEKMANVQVDVMVVAMAVTLDEIMAD